MKIHVGIECDSIEELGKVLRMTGGMDATVRVENETAPEETKPAPKKRGRPKKTAAKKGNGKDESKPQTDAPVEGSVEEAAAAIEPGVKEEVEQLTNVSVDDVRDAIATYSSKHDLAAARELLKRFGAGKVSDVKEQDYAEFVKAASV